jgi:hypothetical protein
MCQDGTNASECLRTTLTNDDTLLQ